MSDKLLKIAVLLSATDKMSSVVNKAFSNAEKRANALKSTSKSISEASDKALIAGGIGTAFFGKTIQDAREATIATNRLNQVFKSMGETNDNAATQASEYASQLQLQIGVEDELIMATQAKLATFKKVSDETARMAGIFDRATAAAFDMEATGFGEASGNAVQLGKALQDPIKGITALSRSGITFTKQEKEKIKTLVQSGQQLKAQKIILDAVEKQVKGVAKATADPTKKMAVAWSEVNEKIGGLLLPTVNKLADKVIAFIPKIQQWIDKHPQLIKFAAALSVGLLVLGGIGKVLAFTISSLSTVINVASTAFKFMGTTLKFVGRIFLTNPIGLIITAIAVAAYLIINNWSKIKAFFIRLWNGVKQIFSAAWNFVKNLFLNYTPHGMIIKHWSKISNFFGNLWKGVKNVFMGFIKWFVNLHVQFYNAGKNIVMSIWNGIKAFISKPIDAIKGMVKKIRNLLPFSPAKEGPLKDIHRIKLVETIASSINAKPLLNAMKNVTGQVFNQRHNAVPVLAGAGGGSMHVEMHFHYNGAGGSTELNNWSRQIKTEVVKAIREIEHNKIRTGFSS